MPPKKYRSITVHVDIYNKLMKIKTEKNMCSFNDVIKMLIDHSTVQR
jgi:predicted CopG family antitoxin